MLQDTVSLFCSVFHLGVQQWTQFAVYIIGYTSADGLCECCIFTLTYFSYFTLILLIVWIWLSVNVILQLLLAAHVFLYPMVSMLAVLKRALQAWKLECATAILITAMVPNLPLSPWWLFLGHSLPPGSFSMLPLPVCIMNIEIWIKLSKEFDFLHHINTYNILCM